MRKLLISILLIIGLSACEKTDNIQEEIPKDTSADTYDSPYAMDSAFRIPILNEVYYDYHDVYGGVYLVDGAYHLNITSDAPEVLLAKIIQAGSVTHHIVSFSYDELWALKEIIVNSYVETEGFASIGVSEKDNTVKVSLITDTIIPDAWSHYIEIGILTVNFQDEYATTLT